MHPFCNLRPKHIYSIWLEKLYFTLGVLGCEGCPKDGKTRRANSIRYLPFITEHTLFMKIYASVNMLFYRQWSTYCNTIQSNNCLPRKICG